MTTLESFDDWLKNSDSYSKVNLVTTSTGFKYAAIDSILIARSVFNPSIFAKGNIITGTAFTIAETSAAFADDGLNGGIREAFCSGVGIAAGIKTGILFTLGSAGLAAPAGYVLGSHAGAYGCKQIYDTVTPIPNF